MYVSRGRAKGEEKAKKKKKSQMESSASPLGDLGSVWTGREIARNLQPFSEHCFDLALLQSNFGGLGQKIGHCELQVQF